MSMLLRDDPSYEHFRPCRAGAKGLVIFVSPEAHAALVAWVRERGESLGALGLEAIHEWAATRGVSLEGEAAQHKDGARSA